MRFRPFLELFVALAFVGCTAKTDLGQVCKMTRPKSDRGPGEEIEEDKVKNPRLDFLALGSAECDDLACIRTADSENPPNEDGKARGYCTAPCIDNTSCEPDFEGKKGNLVCEKLLLDQKFLDDLKEKNREIYDSTFGGGASAKYCVKNRKNP